MNQLIEEYRNLAEETTKIIREFEIIFNGDGGKGIDPISLCSNYQRLVSENQDKMHELHRKIIAGVTLYT